MFDSSYVVVHQNSMESSTDFVSVASSVVFWDTNALHYYTISKKNRCDIASTPCTWQLHFGVVLAHISCLHEGFFVSPILSHWLDKLGHFRTRCQSQLRLILESRSTTIPPINVPLRRHIPMTPCLRTFTICCLVSPSFIVFIFRLFTTHAHPLSMSRTKHGASFVQFSAVFEIGVSR